LRYARLPSSYPDIQPERNTMAWTKPRITEIAVALEINGYACAE